MLTGELRSQIDTIWNAFWSGGISNPLEVIEQITYLLFIRRLDDAHTLEESKALMLKQPMAPRVFPEGSDPKGRKYDDLRWSRFKHFAPGEMYAVVGEHVFPFLRTMGGDGSTYSQHMKDARFTIPPRRCWPRWWTCSTTSRRKTGTPRATSTNTCSARLPAPGRMANSAPRATSSS
jgi:type I restriction enzyme M protein